MLVLHACMFAREYRCMLYKKDPFQASFKDEETAQKLQGIDLLEIN